MEYLSAIGCEPVSQKSAVQIVAANGLIIAPRFTTDWFSCFGLLHNSFPIIAHTLPVAMSRFGILGMDFLRLAKAKIDIPNGRVQIRK